MLRLLYAANGLNKGRATWKRGASFQTRRSTPNDNWFGSHIAFGVTCITVSSYQTKSSCRRRRRRPPLPLRTAILLMSNSIKMKSLQ